LLKNHQDKTDGGGVNKKIEGVTIVTIETTGFVNYFDRLDRIDRFVRYGDPSYSTLFQIKNTSLLSLR